MITRFKKIIQTGVFRNTLGLGAFQFKKFTVFYALNTYGKTTLKDILLSITNDDPSVLEKRKSIPHTNIPQDISLSFSKNGTEHSLNFTDAWNPKDLKGKIVVFDNDFIHKNLITGFSITRENKESFTDFILGEEGVNLSEEIRLLNKSLQDKKATLEKPAYIKNNKNPNEVDDFLNLRVVELEDALQKSKIEIIRNIENLSSFEAISKLPEIGLPKVVIEEKLNSIIEKLNLMLSKDYKDVTEVVKEKLLSHINQCTKGDGAKAWVKQGLKTHMKAADCCPFCGQELANAHELIEAYNNFFNENYEDYSKTIETNLHAIEVDLDKVTISTHTEILTLINNLNKYKKYDPNINTDIEYTDITQLENDVKEKLKIQKEKIKQIINSKNKEPHKAIITILLEKDLLNSIHTLTTFLNDHAELKASINRALNLSNENKSLSNEQLNSKKIELNTIIQEIDKKIARITQDSACKNYLSEIDQINKLNEKITEKSTELKNQQSDYIELYFTELNRQFIALGSSDFNLSCATSPRGHKKVYEIKISYKGKEITSEDISTVLSDSDKRSLAFSIFITKLNHLKNKSDLIIVLDDPVVSFDDNRISSSVDIFKNLCSITGQVILLTHYPSLIKKLINSKTECVYYEIIKNSETSIISELKEDVFILTDQEIAFEKIYSYIERETTEDISKDCRIFMEKYLKFRFHKEIKDKQIIFNNLSELIQELSNKKLISDANFQKAENFRNSLNPEHHEFIFNRNAEDIRNYASNLLTFIYQL